MSVNRQAVLDKYNRHCGYCGCEITLSTMQVDHIFPKRCMGTDDIDNLMPSCRLCNHYKRANSLENYRHLLSTIKERLENVYIFRVAIKYGMINWQQWDGKFYFEEHDIK
jgi:5-methylcytosine-specific restriction endonuclease McrA